MGDISIRQMLDADIESAMRLKNAESWNQTESDWRLFLNYNPEYCLVACLEEEVIGTVTGINYNKEVAWIGMMLVSRECRNQGVGKRLLNAIIERLDECRSIKLDATPAGRPVYERLGFEEELELHRMIVEKIKPASGLAYSGNIRLIQETDIPEIARLDKQAFGSDRTQLIQHLVKNLPGQSWMSEENGKANGYISGRKGTRFNHLGPLVADSIEAAKALLAKVAGDLAGKPAVIDIPASKTDWRNWLSGLGFSQQRSLTRMYLKNNCIADQSDFHFAICGPEIG